MASMTFKKHERLAHKKKIQELFAKGSSFYLYPFKVFYIPDPQLTYNEILISVPRRNFKKAVFRNLLKRRIREAYRINKHLFNTPHKLRIGYIYTSKDLLDYNFIQKKLVEATERLNKEFS